MVHLIGRPGGLRHPRSSRLTFQICPHAVQRQYVDALGSLLVVFTLRESQNGQVVGATVSAGWVYICTRHRHVGSVDRTRQEIPIALRADKKRRTGAVRGRTRLGTARHDKVRHRRYRGGREKNGLGDGAVMYAHPSTTTVTRTQEQAGTVRPTRRP